MRRRRLPIPVAANVEVEMRLNGIVPVALSP